MAAWKTRQHLEDHVWLHGRELRARSVSEYDASAQETIAIGNRFTYRTRQSYERRIGYLHRETSRFVGTDLDGSIRTHYQTDEDHVAGLIESTYRD